MAFLKGQSEHSHYPNYELYFAEMPTSIVEEQFGLKPEVSIFEQVFEFIKINNFCSIWLLNERQIAFDLFGKKLYINL